MLAVIVAVTGAIAAPALAALAASAGGQSQTVSTATLAAPTALAALPVCTILPAYSQRVDLVWTPTTSSFADAYVIRRATASGGPYTAVGTVGPGAAAYSDTTVAASRTYYYVVDAARNLWRASSPETAVTTKSSPLCL